MQTAIAIAKELEVDSIQINHLATEQFKPAKNVEIFAQLEYTTLGLETLSQKLEFKFEDGINMEPLQENEQIEDKNDRHVLRGVCIVEDALKCLSE